MAFQASVWAEGNTGHEYHGYFTQEIVPSKEDIYQVIGKSHTRFT